MIVTRRSPLTGVIRTRSLPITDQQLVNWEGGMLAQDAFPQLSADEREFIMTGITPEEWDRFMGGEDE